MVDADLISAIRNIRHLVATLDSIGFSVTELCKDEELEEIVVKDLPDKIKSMSSDIHAMIQRTEKGKRYRDAVQKLCTTKVRE